MTDNAPAAPLSSDARLETTAPAVKLTPLKTVLELRAANAVVDVFITHVPVKSANSVISCVFHCPSLIGHR